LPKYINTSARKKYVLGHYIPPGGSVETTVYVNDPNLILDSHEPYVKKSVLMCEDIELTPEQELEIAIPHPTSNNLYYLSVIFIDKAYELFIDMDSTAIPLIIDNITYFHELLNWDIHAYIKLVNPSTTETVKARVTATSC